MTARQRADAATRGPKSRTITIRLPAADYSILEGLANKLDLEVEKVVATAAIIGADDAARWLAKP